MLNIQKHSSLLRNKYNVINYSHLLENPEIQSVHLIVLCASHVAVTKQQKQPREGFIVP